MKKSKKIVSLVLAASMLSSTTASFAMPGNTVIIGDDVYDVEALFQESLNDEIKTSLEKLGQSDSYDDIYFQLDGTNEDFVNFDGTKSMTEEAKSKYESYRVTDEFGNKLLFKNFDDKNGLVGVETRAGLENVLKSRFVGEIVVEKDIDIGDEVIKINKLVDIDLNGKTLKGNIVVDTESEGNMNIKGMENSAIEGNLIVKSKGANFIIDENTTVKGKTTVSDMGGATFVNKGKLEEVVVEDSKGASIQNDGELEKVKVATKAKVVLKGKSKIGELKVDAKDADVELGVDAANVVADTAFKLVKKENVTIEKLTGKESAKVQATDEKGHKINSNDITKPARPTEGNKPSKPSKPSTPTIPEKQQLESPKNISIEVLDDGAKLVGTTEFMEYSTSKNGNNWIQCDEGETKVSEGTYFVRMKADKGGNLASDSVKLSTEVVPNKALRQWIVVCLNKDSYNIDGENWVDQDPRTYKPTIEDIKKLKKMYAYKCPDYADKDSITDLYGLRYAENLEELNINGMSVSDLSHISDLQNLKEIQAGGNRVKSFDFALGMDKLEKLDLSNNDIDKVTDLSGLKSLKELSLSENGLKTLSGIGKIPSLVKLEANQNKLTNLRGIEGFENLESIWVYKNQINDVSAIKGLSSIKEISMYQNNIEDISAFSELYNLEWLEIMKNKIRDVSPLAKLVKLNHLTFKNNRVKDISSLKDLVNLTYFHVYENGVEDISIIKNMKKLVEFNFSRNNVKDLTPVIGLTNLETLYGYENEVEDITPAMTLPNLKTFNLYRNSVLDLSSLKDKVKYQIDGYEAYKDIIMNGEHRTITLGFDNIDFEKQNKHWVVRTKNPVILPNGNFGYMRDVKKDGTVIKTITKNAENDTVEFKMPLEYADHNMDQINTLQVAFLYEEAIPYVGWDMLQDKEVNGREFSGSIDFVIPADCDIICTRMKIEALPAPSDITLADADIVKAARVAYTFLTQDTDKDLEANLVKKLEDVEYSLAKLTTKDLVAKIDALYSKTNLTEDDCNQIDDMFWTYLDLSEKEQALVTNYDKYLELKERVKQFEAKAIETEIAKLPSLDELTLEYETQIDRLIKRYDSLKEFQKRDVKNYDVLKSAKQKIDELSGDDNAVYKEYKKENTLIATLHNNGQLIVADGITELDEALFNEETLIKSVVIPEGVTKIGKTTFYKCSNLKEVTMPSSMKSIGYGAFSRCTALSTINLNDGLTSVSEGAFLGCSALENIVIPDSVTSIGEKAFSECTSLKTVKLPSGIQEISKNIVLGCDALKSFVIPENVSTIYPESFEGVNGSIVSVAEANTNFISEDCIIYSKDKSKLIMFLDKEKRNYTVGSAVKSIGEKAFNASNVEIIVLPSTIQSLDKKAFYGNSKIKTVVMNGNLKIIPDMAFSKCESLESVVIPEGITSIGKYAFRECSALKSVELPSTIATIGDYAFRDCNALTNLTIKEGVTSIGKYAFSYCDSLKSVELPSTIATIGDCAFRECNTLTDVTIKEGVTSINKWTFYKCAAIESVKLPSTLTALDPKLLVDAKSLKSITLGGNLKTIPKKIFSGFKNLEYAKISEGTTTIDEQAFYECPALERVELPSTLEKINYGVFSGCSSLNNLKFSEGLELIDDNAFYSCSALESIELPSTLNGINYAAFGSCTSLTDVTMKNGIKKIGYGAFLGCSNINEINVPASVIEIGEWAFSELDSASNINVDSKNANYCDKDGVLYDKAGRYLMQYLKSKDVNYTIPEGTIKIAKGAFSKTGIETVNMPDTLEEIGFSAFEGCEGLTSVEVPKNVTLLNHHAFSKAKNIERVILPDGLKTIGRYAFRGIEKLTNIDIPNTVTSLDDWSFKDCKGLTEITIPNSVNRIGKEAFIGCDNLKKIIVDNVAGELQIGDKAIPDSVEVVYLKTEISDDQEVTMSDEVKAFYVELFNEKDGDYKNLTDEANTSYAPLTTDHVFTVADMKMLKNFYVDDRNVDDSLVAPLKYAINLESFIVELDDSAYSRDLVDFNCLKKCKKVKKVYYLNNDLNMDSDSEDSDGSGTCSIHGCGNTKAPLKDISALTTMSDLEDLRINMTELKDLDSITNLNLKTLKVTGNMIETVKDSIGNMTSLEIIDIGHNRVTSILNFDHLTNLQEVYVNDNGISYVSYLSSLSNLESLWINGNPLAEDYMSELKGFSNIDDLKVADISKDDFDWIKTLAKNNSGKHRFAELEIELDATRDMIQGGVLTIKNPLKGLSDEPVIQNEYNDEVSLNKDVSMDGDEIKIKLSDADVDSLEVSYPAFTEESSASIAGKVTLDITINQEDKELSDPKLNKETSNANMLVVTFNEYIDGIDVQNPVSYAEKDVDFSKSVAKISLELKDEDKENHSVTIETYKGEDRHITTFVYKMTSGWEKE